MPYKFHCTKCSFRCKRKKGFKRHLKGHDERNLKIYKCPDCEFSSLSQIQLSKHTIVHCEDRFYCNFCSFQTHLLKTLENHVKKKHKNNKDIKYYNCPSCNYKIAERKKKVIMAHLETHPELKDSEELKAIRHKVSLKFKCDLCQFKAQTVAEVTAHKKTTHDKVRRSRSFKCHLCLFKSLRKAELTTHKNSEHGIIDLQSLKCHLCQFVAQTKTELTTHINSEHGIMNCDKVPRLRSFKCHLCPFKAYTTAELTTHQKAEHAGMKPHPCDDCEASYKQKHDLQIHRMMKHAEIYGLLQQYTCNICEKKCTSEARLKRHEACHGADAAVFCDICGVGFPNHHQRLRHMKTSHKIGIPCLHCDNFFSTRQGLSRHMRKKHAFSSETIVEVIPELNSSETQCLEVSTEVDNFISVMEVWDSTG